MNMRRGEDRGGVVPLGGGAPSPLGHRGRLQRLPEGLESPLDRGEAQAHLKERTHADSSPGLLGQGHLT